MNIKVYIDWVKKNLIIIVIVILIIVVILIMVYVYKVGIPSLLNPLQKQITGLSNDITEIRESLTLGDKSIKEIISTNEATASRINVVYKSLSEINSELSGYRDIFAKMSDE